MIITDLSKVASVIVRGHSWIIGWDQDTSKAGRSCWAECVKLGGNWHVVEAIFCSDFCDELDAALAALPDNQFPGVDIDAVHKKHKGT